MKALGWLAIGGVGLVVLDYLGYVDVSSWFKTTTVPSDGTSTTPQANNPNAAVQNTTLGLIAKSVADH
jgi:hypothetical protein